VPSPFAPASAKACVLLPPMADRLAATANVTLVGLVPRVTTTVSRVPEPACTLLGVALPVPDGLVEPPPPPQTLVALALLRGVGARALKSVPLLFASVQPLTARSSAVVVLGAGAFAPPSLQLAVVP